jgi:hypothetical protein
VSTDQLAAILAERVMGWRRRPDRFLKDGRQWSPHWRFRPTHRLEDADRLLERAAPQEYSVHRTGDGRFQVKVRIAGAIGEATESSQARAISFAIARAIGVEVDK